MIITVSITDTIQVNDAAVYLQEGNTASYSNKDTKPVILVPKKTTDSVRKQKTVAIKDSAEQKQKKTDSAEQKPTIKLPK